MSDDFIGKELLGQFRVLERIGRGGMGEVYKAAQPAMERMVAIKILHAKLAQRPDLVSRFRREARAMSRLSHPNSVRVFLYGHLEDTDQLYIAMEYLDGIDLARLVRKEGPVEYRRAIRIMIQVLGALEEAHSVGVIHRDLKPENILLTKQGGISDFPKVLDFGLAKIRESKPRPGSLVLTREGMVFGTPEFMSPEQARGETLDGRSDIYSAGLIFYELVTGQLPFPRSKPMEYISHHIKTPPIPISQRDHGIDLPKALDPIILTALEKDRNSRFSSAREFADALRTLLPKAEQASSEWESAPTINENLSPSAATQAMPKRSMSTPATISVLEPKPSVQVQASKLDIGKTLVIALSFIIFALLGLVIYLLVTRNTQEPNAIPVNTPAQIIGVDQQQPTNIKPPLTQ